MKSPTISTAKAFRFTGMAAFILGMLTTILAAIAYAPTNPDFSIFNTYLSDIGDTAGWPQILFNNGTLLSAPLRYAILILLVLRMRTIAENKKSFEIVFLIIGAFSTLGTILMTAVPFSVGPSVHKSGIGLYFLGVVFLQGMLAVKQIKTKSFPRVLPALSIFIVICYLVFFVLVMLSQAFGVVGRETPIFWEWMCFFSSMAWLLGHTIVLGREKIS
jgi:hypothetical membrane protein